MFNIDINKNLNDQQKNIHSVFSDYMTKMGVIDLGNHFSLYEYVDRNVELKKFLVSEAKKSINNNDIKKYSCIDGANSGWLKPRLFFVNSNYIVDISKNKDIFVYDNNMELIFKYNINFNSFSISRIDSKISGVSFNNISNFFDFSIGPQLSINRSIKSGTPYSLFDEGNDDNDKSTINQIHFNESNIELLFKRGMYEKLILDYNFNILSLVFSQEPANKLQVKEINNPIDFNGILEKLKTNFDLYFLTTDSPYLSQQLKEQLQDNISNIKQLTFVKEKLFKTFNQMESMNEKYINSIDNKYFKNYLFKFFNLSSKITKTDLDSDLNSNIENLFSTEKTLKTKEYTENYYSTMATLKLLKDNNENLIDLNLIENIIKLENMIKDLTENFKNKKNSLMSKNNKIK